MPEPLNQSAIEQIHQIVRQLARKQGLDAEEVEEIGAHLEDKLLGYLSGEVRITEGDALLLARAHFGDAAGVAKQLADSDVAGPEAPRRRQIRSIATKTALCTLVFLPIALVLFAQTPDMLPNLFGAGLIILVGLGILEAGVLLAARTNLRSRWQRAVAAAFVIPSLVVLPLASISGMSAFAAHFNSAARAGYGIIVATVLASWTGHCLLFLLLASPLPRTRPKVAI
jgi:hypothetical protein